MPHQFVQNKFVQEFVTVSLLIFLILETASWGATIVMIKLINFR